jgi:hypothetical protein
MLWSNTPAVPGLPQSHKTHISHLKQIAVARRFSCRGLMGRSGPTLKRNVIIMGWIIIWWIK